MGKPDFFFLHSTPSLIFILLPAPLIQPVLNPKWSHGMFSPGREAMWRCRGRGRGMGVMDCHGNPACCRVWMVFCLLTSSSLGQALASAGAWALHPVSPISGIRPNGIHPNRSPGSSRVSRTECFLLTPCPAAAALPSWEVTDSRGCSPTLWRESSCFLLHFILSSLSSKHEPLAICLSPCWLAGFAILSSEFLFIS